jgi:hypothetical protein
MELVEIASTKGEFELDLLQGPIPDAVKDPGYYCWEAFCFWYNILSSLVYLFSYNIRR